MSLSEVDRMALERATLFIDCPPSVRTALLDVAQPVRLAKDDILFRCGDRAEAFFVVLRGWIGLYRQGPEGKRAELGLVGPSESFAEASRDLRRHPADAQALTKTRLARLAWPALAEQLRASPALEHALAASISRHLDRMVRRSADLSLLTAPERLAQFILARCPEGKRAVRIRLPYAKSLLARDLGVSPETLSRAFACLAQSEVSIDRRDIIVHDVSSLRQVVRGS